MCALRDWFGNGGNLEQNNKLKPFNCQHIGVAISEFAAKLAKVIQRNKTNYHITWTRFLHLCPLNKSLEQSIDEKSLRMNRL